MNSVQLLLCHCIRGFVENMVFAVEVVILSSLEAEIQALPVCRQPSVICYFRWHCTTLSLVPLHELPILENIVFAIKIVTIKFKSEYIVASGFCQPPSCILVMLFSVFCNCPITVTPKFDNMRLVLVGVNVQVSEKNLPKIA